MAARDPFRGHDRDIAGSPTFSGLGAAPGVSLETCLEQALLGVPPQDAVVMFNALARSPANEAGSRCSEACSPTDSACQCACLLKFLPAVRREVPEAAPLHDAMQACCRQATAKKAGFGWVVPVAVLAAGVWWLSSRK